MQSGLCDNDAQKALESLSNSCACEFIEFADGEEVPTGCGLEALEIEDARGEGWVNGFSALLPQGPAPEPSRVWDVRIDVDDGCGGQVEVGAAADSPAGALEE